MDNNLKYTPKQLPCPFCGERPIWINEILEDDHYYLKCVTCNFFISADRRDKVIGLWNTRLESANLHKIKEELADLKQRHQDVRNVVRDQKKEKDKLKVENEQLLEALETTVTGIEWTIENHPERMDKSDYEHYDNLKMLIEKSVKEVSNG